MIWQEPYADLARDRQRALLDDAENQRLMLQVNDGSTSRYREWLACQLVILAFRLAPSLRSAVPGFADWADATRLRPSANGNSLALLI